MTRANPKNPHSVSLNLSRPLLKWFDRHQRVLPWRQQTTAYRIWVSEIMLQQTQVKTVVPYFERFLAEFPTIEHLANADLAQVLKLWEGLGYYRRARHLQAAAQLIVERHQGVFPIDFESVLSLPGIGRYTAGAILSIALDQRQPILEGNTIRLYSRLLALRSDPRSSVNQKRLWEFAESILPQHRVGDFNQALMELGSEICTPQSPACERCPLLKFCPTFAQKLQDQIPAAGRKVNYESIQEAVVLICRTGKFLVRVCQPGERWAGLWDFPRFRLGNSQNSGSAKTQQPLERVQILALEDQVKNSTGLAVRLQPTSWTIQHTVTRYRISLACFRSSEVTGRLLAPARTTPADASPATSRFRWANREELNQLAMSATGRKLVNKLGSFLADR